MSASISSSRACYSAICRTSSGTWSIRARATAGCRFPLNASRASAHSQSTPVTSFERVIAAFLPLRRRLAGKLERSGPVADGVRFPAIFSSHEGPLRLICNFLGAFKALRSLSSNALVQFLQEPASSIFHGFQFAPVPLCAVAHVSNMHRGASENAEIKAGNVRNVVR